MTIDVERVTHNQNVSDERVYEFAADELDDFEKFIASITVFHEMQE